MKRKYHRVYQFKISLKGTRPPIWRRIQVRETYTFRDFHNAIQDAMGWEDYHLHEFVLSPHRIRGGVRIGRPEDGLDGVLPEGKQKIADYFSLENNKGGYVYDFGDNWEHTLKLEKILPGEEGVDYPICTGGKRACPPEDCGGVWGYEELLHIINNPEHKEHEEMLEWIGGEFDPEHFDKSEVKFHTRQLF